VVGIETPQGSEAMAVLILNDRSANAALAVQHANQRLSPHQRIRHWKLWPEPEFPLTPTKKIRKAAVAGRMATGEEEQGSPGEREQGGWRDGAVAAIVRRIARGSGAEAQPAELTANLSADLKLDSLGRVELLSALEDRYQLELDETAFTEATTVG